MHRFGDSKKAVVPSLRPPNLQWALYGPGHAVQFYEADSYLRQVVRGFLADGLNNGQPVISIASRQHTDMFRSDLSALGFSMSELRARGELWFLDANQLADEILVGGVLDAARFRAVVGTVLDRAGGRHRVVRAYGEIVDVLCEAGNAPAALGLERLWNELASDYHLALLCGYAVDHFMCPESAAAFEEVCGQHQHVISGTGIT